MTPATAQLPSERLQEHAEKHLQEDIAAGRALLEKAGCRFRSASAQQLAWNAMFDILVAAVRESWEIERTLRKGR